MKNPTMLYKHPGKHDIHGDKFDYVIVSSDEVEAKVSEGWARTTDEAKSGKKSEPKEESTPKKRGRKKAEPKEVDFTKE